MSRIRSVHPGLWTDERFVSVSVEARLLAIGIWNECDDQGSFEWAPLKLKMRLLPADHVDAEALLGELEDARLVLKYEVDGKAYGAVRNFQRYQRPKKPNSIHPQTDEVRKWVDTEARSKRDGGEAVGNQSRTGSEKARQMKDGGGRRDTPVSNETGRQAAEKKFWDAAKALLADHAKDPGALVNKWLRDHGKELTTAAINAAQLENAVDPIAYVEGYFRRHDPPKAKTPLVPL
ncbi:hypothetical protein WJT74_05070 [Sphingomicrobium sp. XHP0239]|uniref:hypothetical protein n=1 Tax=Sphingomicrobium maritimum TaxID=3133972 RepID=UPI0031CCBF01